MGARRCRGNAYGGALSDGVSVRELRGPDRVGNGTMKSTASRKTTPTNSVPASFQRSLRTTKCVAAIMKKTAAMSGLRPCLMTTSRNGGETHIRIRKAAATRGAALSSRISRGEGRRPAGCHPGARAQPRGRAEWKHVHEPGRSDAIAERERVHGERVDRYALVDEVVTMRHRLVPDQCGLRAQAPEPRPARAGRLSSPLHATRRPVSVWSQRRAQRAVPASRSCRARAAARTSATASRASRPTCSPSASATSRTRHSAC
jgi:hypothetical protein